MAFSGFPNCGNPSRCGGEGELYLQHFCRAEDTFDPVLVEVGHTTVHELQKDLQVLVARPIQDDNQLSIERGVLEQLGEVGAAGGQDQPVCLEGLAWGQRCFKVKVCVKVKLSGMAMKAGNR